MMFKKKFLLFWVFCLFFGFFLGVFYDRVILSEGLDQGDVLSEVKGEEQGEITTGAEIERKLLNVRLKIDFDGGRVEVYENVKIKEGETALDLLLAISGENDFLVEIEEFSMGKFIKGIDSVLGDDNKFWSFWTNGKMAEVGADEYEVRDEDIIEFKLISF